MKNVYKVYYRRLSAKTFLFKLCRVQKMQHKELMRDEAIYEKLRFDTGKLNIEKITK